MKKRKRISVLTQRDNADTLIAVKQWSLATHTGDRAMNVYESYLIGQLGEPVQAEFARVYEAIASAQEALAGPLVAADCCCADYCAASRAYQASRKPEALARLRERFAAMVAANTVANPLADRLRDLKDELFRLKREHGISAAAIDALGESRERALDCAGMLISAARASA